MVNKKGDMTIGMIVAIVLAVTVLVFLIFGFSTGWGNFMSKVTNLGGGKVNVDDVIGSCNLACEQGNNYAYCSQNRTVIAADGYEGKFSCKQLGESTELNLTNKANNNISISGAGIKLDKCANFDCE